MCLQVHKGPRVLHALDQTSEPIHPSKGIIVGCPFGVVFAKVVLWTLMAHGQGICRPQGLTTWVDDIGVDFRGFTPAQVATQAVNTFLELRQGLVSRGLEINTKKSGFLVRDVETGKALKAALAPYTNCPSLKEIIKDLGVDNSLARKRRLAVHHTRLWKGRVRLKRSSSCLRGPGVSLSTWLQILLPCGVTWRLAFLRKSFALGGYKCGANQ